MVEREVYDLVIVNGVVVIASEIRQADVAIKGETIAAIRDYGGFEDAQVGRRIDAEGGWVMPGGIVRKPCPQTSTWTKNNMTQDAHVCWKTFQ